MKLYHAPTAGNHQFAIVDEATGNDIALVYNRNAESEKIAQLLAAAPDLLEALQQLVKTDKSNADHFHRAVCDAERAILKATTPTDHKQ